MTPHGIPPTTTATAHLISFEDDNDAAAITKKIPAYANGELVWGEEPDGTTPSDTTETKPSETTTTMQSTTTTTVTSASVSGSGSDTGTADVLYGDTNLDGRVDITDAVLLNRAVKRLRFAECTGNQECRL